MPATAVKNTGNLGRRSRGKKQPRRWAQKLEGSIINTRRKINHDDAGQPFPDSKKTKTVLEELYEEVVVLQKDLALADARESLI